MGNWVVRAKRANFQQLAETCHIDQVIARILVNRGYDTPELISGYLNPPETEETNPFLLKDMDLACDIVLDAISKKNKIRIIGDYDVDGIMSTYILNQGLTSLGANVDYYIPHRVEDGYGISEKMVEQAFSEGAEFIITCDNGIAARPALERARSLGLTVVVTDHHQVPFAEENGKRIEILPPADAVVDPQREEDVYPFKEICGAQVAYKFIDAIYRKSNSDRTGLKDLRQFAAIAAICDVMPLAGENRALVYYGLKDLSATTNMGMKALLVKNDLYGKKLNVNNISFVIGPCLNASGRLDIAAKAVELLKAWDSKECNRIAEELVVLNEERKNMTIQGQEQALQLVKDLHMENDKVLVLYIPALHESLSGLVAGRVKEIYNRPTIVFSDCEQGAKGSGRSIEGYNMFEELNALSDMIIKFGGHPMAAGLTVKVSDIGKLREKLNTNCTLRDEDFQEKVYIDVPMPLSYINEDLVDELEMLEPFGKGNSKPVFAVKDAKIYYASYMGAKRQYLKLYLQKEDGGIMEGLLFKDVEGFIERLEEVNGKGTFDDLLKSRGTVAKMTFTYYPTINDFRGEKTLQVVIDKFA